MTEENPIQPEKESFLKSLIKWVIILAIIAAAFGYIGYKYSLVSVDEFKNWLGGINIAKGKPAAVNAPIANPTQELIVTETKPVDPVVTAPEQFAIAVPPPQNISNNEIALLKEKQKYFGLYLAARDLRDAKNNPEKFTNELRYFTVVAADNTEIAGKIDILRLSTESGLVTVSKLRDELGMLVQNMEKEQAKGLWESIKYSLGNLVRVTKIKGEADSMSPREIKIRAEKFLDNGDLTGAIREVQKLGPRADDWVRQANNLVRVYEITDYLVDYARNKIKF